MWNDFDMRQHYRDRVRSGVAPRRYEIVARAYADKIRARHEAEQRVATIGRAMQALSPLWGPMRYLFAPKGDEGNSTLRDPSQHPAR